MRDNSGAIAIVTGLMIPVLAGFAGLAVDVSYWYMERRGLQNAVDAAAIAGAHELANNNSAGVLAAATDGANRNGFDATSGATITANVPPTSGPNVGNVGAVEARIQDNLPLYFSDVFLTNPVTVVVRAVASTIVVDEFCLLALDPTADAAIDLSDSAYVATEFCGLMANSSSPSAFSMSGSTLYEGKSAAVVGDFLIQGAADLAPEDPPESGSRPGVDPMSSYSMPPYSGCGGGTNTTIGATGNISPGVYCDGLTITGGGTVTMAPGEYFIDGGDLTIENASELQGNGVTIFLTGSPASDIATLSITGNSRLEITAPTTGAYAGVNIFQDRNAPTTERVEIVGDPAIVTPRNKSELEVDGIVYFPSQEIFIAGSGRLEAEPTGCPKVLARKIKMTGTSELEINCNPAAIPKNVGRATVKLSE